MTYHAIDAWGVAASVGTLLVAIGASRRYRLDLERDLVVGGIRAFAQMTLVGWILDWIFGNPHPLFVLSVLAWMCSWAAYDAVRRQKRPVPGMFRVLLLAIAGAMAANLVVSIVAVVRPDPIWNPRYVLPLAGMLAANAMNAASMAVRRLAEGLVDRAPEIEMRLALGATPRGAAAGVFRDAIQNALIPAVNSLMVAGIVHLPGMMAGQIIAGASATEAVKYQILVLFTFGSSCVVASILAARLALNLYFTEYSLKYQ